MLKIRNRLVEKLEKNTTNIYELDSLADFIIKNYKPSTAQVEKLIITDYNLFGEEGIKITGLQNLSVVILTQFKAIKSWENMMYLAVDKTFAPVLGDNFIYFNRDKFVQDNKQHRNIFWDLSVDTQGFKDNNFYSFHIS